MSDTVVPQIVHSTGNSTKPQDPTDEWDVKFLTLKSITASININQIIIPYLGFNINEGFITVGPKTAMC